MDLCATQEVVIRVVEDGRTGSGDKLELGH